MRDGERPPRPELCGTALPQWAVGEGDGRGRASWEAWAATTRARSGAGSSSAGNKDLPPGALPPTPFRAHGMISLSSSPCGSLQSDCEGDLNTFLHKTRHESTRIGRLIRSIEQICMMRYDWLTALLVPDHWR